MTLKDLISLLRNSKTFEEIDIHKKEIATIIPKVKEMFDFDQKNRAHCYDLWGHCVHTVLNLPKDIDDDMVYLAALVHDIGKPSCQVEDYKDGKPNYHYYGHQAMSRDVVVKDILPYFKSHGITLDDDKQRRLIYYVYYHDDYVNIKIKYVRKYTEKIGVSITEFQNLMKLQVADAKAHNMFDKIFTRITICETLAGETGLELYNSIKDKEKRD